MAGYDSANEEDPAAAGHPAGVGSLHLLGVALTSHGMLKAANGTSTHRAVKFRRLCQ